MLMEPIAIMVTRANDLNRSVTENCNPHLESQSPSVDAMNATTTYIRAHTNNTQQPILHALHRCQSRLPLPRSKTTRPPSRLPSSPRKPSRQYRSSPIRRPVKTLPPTTLRKCRQRTATARGRKNRQGPLRTLLEHALLGQNLRMEPPASARRRRPAALVDSAPTDPGRERKPNARLSPPSTSPAAASPNLLTSRHLRTPAPPHDEPLLRSHSRHR